MSDQLLNSLSIGFDIKNHRELSPLIYFTETALYCESQNSYFPISDNNFRHLQSIPAIIHDIESAIYDSKLFDKNIENIEDKSFESLSPFYTYNSSLIDDEFCHPIDVIESQKYDLSVLFSFLKKKLTRDLRQQPISTQRFPHFVNHEITDLHALQDIDIDQQNTDREAIKQLQKDEEKMNSIITKNSSKFSINELIEFYDTIKKYRKSFTFRPSFILTCIQNFNSFLSSFLDDSNKPSQNSESENLIYNDQDIFKYFLNIDSESCSDEEKQERKKYFRIVLIIKMRLNMMIHKTVDFLIALIELIVFDEKNQTSEDDQFTFKNFINEILPDTKKRSEIITNISIDEITDFYFSKEKQQSDFILTEKGLFKYQNDSLEKVEIELNYSNSKIAFSDGILYIVSPDDKRIHKISVPQVEDENKKDSSKAQKAHENGKERKRLSKKSLRKIERKKAYKKEEDERKDEINLDDTIIDIPDYPIFSIGAYDNNVRIIQLKGSNDGKATMIFTNVDLIPNSRINYNIEEAFSDKLFQTAKQTQFEFEIRNNNEKSKLANINFSKDNFYVSFDDSSLQKWTIFNENGICEFTMNLVSPFIFSSNSKTKMDNNMFLYILEPISNSSEKAVSSIYFNFSTTNYYLRSENGFFLKHPYLQKLSDIVDNCSQFIINRKVTTPSTTADYYESRDEDKEKVPPKSVELPVSPEEMSSMFQSVNSLVSQFESIEFVINNLKDEEMKRFFICLFIKMSGICLLYGTNFYYASKDSMIESQQKRFAKFKSFIMNLFSSFGTSNSNDFEIIVRESIIITFCLAGKFIFLPDSYEDLHSFMKKVLSLDDESENYKKHLIRSLSFLFFKYPSSLYIIDESIYKELLKYDQEINLHQLFYDTILFIKLENRFSQKIIDNEFIRFIEPYIQCLFKYIKRILNDESVPITKAIQLLYFFTIFEFDNPTFNLIALKAITSISKELFNRINKIKGVIENDDDFYEKHKNSSAQKVTKITKVLESEHPFVLSNDSKDDDEIEEILGTIDFDADIDSVFFIPDRCELQEGDKITFYFDNSKSDTIIFQQRSDFDFNQASEIKSKNIKATLTRKNKNIDDKCWGYKFTFIGVSIDYKFYWPQNVYLNFFNIFISSIIGIYCNAASSTSKTDEENEFNLILANNLIQGIKLEDIDNYEANINQQKPKKIGKRQLSRGISRGINYDTDNDSLFDEKIKKSFINDLITVDEKSSSLGKILFDILYTKTAKQSRIRLNQGTQSILIAEHYLAACLFKQLGMINTCIKLVNSYQNNDSNDVEIPSRILLIWKNIYSLRKILFFEYQQSKINRPNQSKKYNFVEFTEEVKRKCKLLLYSDPILKFNAQSNLSNEKFEETMKSIMSFATSKTPLSKITDIIDIQRKRLQISIQANELILQFLDQNSMFKSSRLFAQFSYGYNYHPLKHTNALTTRELDDYYRLKDKVQSSFLKDFYKYVTIPSIVKENHLRYFLDNKFNDEVFKVFVDILNENKQNKSFLRDRFIFSLIRCLFSLSIKSSNNEIIEKMFSLLTSDEIDVKCKQLILTFIPCYTKIHPENLKVFDKNFALSFLSDNSHNPVIVKTLFYWLSQLINPNTDADFIKKVLRGIGQAFCGQSCLFIDESFSKLTHRQVSEGMISFVRLFIKHDKDFIFNIMNDIISNINGSNIASISDENAMILIGLFASLCQSLSAFVPERYYMFRYNSNNFIGYNSTKNEVRSHEQNVFGTFTNCVSLDYRFLDLNEKGISSILQLHDILSTSKYFVNEINYEQNISEREIEESILISAFYSSLPMIFQNVNNAKIILNSDNINHSLSLFKFAQNKLPINENNITLLGHFLEKAINSPLYQIKEKDELKRIDKNGSFRFMKMNFGDIIYNDNNDLIKTNSNHMNLFICNRPIDSSYETYFEVKINKMGRKQMFFGFVDSEDCLIDKAFGFGSLGAEVAFCRRSPYLSSVIDISEDTIMKEEQIQTKKDEKEDNKKSNENQDKSNENQDKSNENQDKPNENQDKPNENQDKPNENQDKSNENQDKSNESQEKSNENQDNHKVFMINEGDSIGLYFTTEYCYLVINGKLTQYRVIHNHVNTYVPLIYIDHDEIELEITQNVTKVDHKDPKFDFLNITNYSPDYFNEKDLKKLLQVMQKNSQNNLTESNHLIGQQVYIDKKVLSIYQLKMESIEAYTSNLYHYIENYGIIRDIIPLESTPFVTKLKIETYNDLTKSNEIIEIDSRYVSECTTNFFNLIENQANTKLSFNSSFDFKDLPDQLKNTSDFNSITSYLKHKTIIDNSKSIALIMCKYLTLVLVDYLRYSKSPLLLDEAINSEEMNVIIKSLALSLPTITLFKPKLYRQIDKYDMSDCTIFSEDTEVDNGMNYYFLIPGYRKQVSFSFQIFLKLSEKFISKQFLSKLLQALFESTEGKFLFESSKIYDLIPQQKRIETISPLIEKFKFSNPPNYDFYINKVIGVIPILIDSIPYQLQCLVSYDKRIRQSSDIISYFTKESCFKWKYNIEKIKEQNKSFDFSKIQDYRLKFGLFEISKYLDENILNSMGFIQVVFLIIQAFNSSNILYEKNEETLKNELIVYLFKLAKITNPIAFPFIQTIIVSFMSKITISSDILVKQASDSIPIFTSNSNGLYKLDSFPDSKNEIPLLLSIFSILIQTHSFELSIDDLSQEKIEKLFDKYYEINNEIFNFVNDQVNRKKIKFIEGDNTFESNDIKKNYRSLYLAYYYSLLLINDINLPYPKFLFVHDWIMQHFGGFRKVLSKVDIDHYNKQQKDEKETSVVYKSDVLDNKFDLVCSYKLLSNKSDEDESENKENEYKIVVHQIKNDEKIVIPDSGESVVVSFPLEILVVHEKAEKEKELTKEDVFIITFCPSKEQQQDCFVQNFINIENDFKDFTSLSKYDNEISEKIISSSDIGKKENNNENNNQNNNENNNQNNNENNNQNNNENNNQNNNENNNQNNNENNNQNNNENNNQNNNENNNQNNNENNNQNNDNNNENHDESEKNIYKMFEIEKIPETVSIEFSSSSSYSDRIVSLRIYTQSVYRRLIEEILTSYALDERDFSGQYENRYLNQIISPAYSMSTTAKFQFINTILMNDDEDDENRRLNIVFNRFEQQKFMEKFQESPNKEKISNTARPLFIQFMEQVDEDSIQYLKVYNKPPFVCDLIGENSNDVGGPGRELFTQLIEELMNVHIGIFTINPNRLHNNKDTNKEDLIPNISSGSVDSNDDAYLYPKRFVYAGALIAVCFMSSIPQPMKLAMFIWEYLSHEKVTIESIYEIDEDFKVMIQTGESIMKVLQSNPDEMSDELFNQIFTHAFEIDNSFGKKVELIPSGSKIKVTKTNIGEFIDQAKKFRMEEFINVLTELKEGFDKVMTYKNIIKILRPSELKLLICGEPECKIEQMKNFIDFYCNDNVDYDKAQDIFWKVMESFSVKERMDFIRFSSGNLSLPAPGMKFERNIEVNVLSPGKHGPAGDKMAYAHTCFAQIDIPFYDSEEELASILRASIGNYGLITDHTMNIDAVSEFL